MSKIDYTNKYKELRANFLSATERSYSIGYEHGQRDAMIQQMQQQQEQQMQMQAMMAQQGGMPPEEGPEGQEMPPEESMDQMGDQMDQAQMEGEQSEIEAAINELESILGSGEDVDKAEAAKVVSQMVKSLSSIKEIQARMELRKSMQFQPLNKTERMKTISVGLNKEVKKYQQDTGRVGKKTLSLQKQMVNSIVDKMRKEEETAINQILKNLKTQGLAE